MWIVWRPSKRESWLLWKIIFVSRLDYLILIRCFGDAKNLNEKQYSQIELFLFSFWISNTDRFHYIVTVFWLLLWWWLYPLRIAFPTTVTNATEKYCDDFLSLTIYLDVQETSLLNDVVAHYQAKTVKKLYIFISLTFNWRT